MAVPDPSDLAEAARMLRAISKAVPAVNAVERRTARRIEGAAVALALLAETADSEASHEDRGAPRSEA